jgi:hypothetical protein
MLSMLVTIFIISYYKPDEQRFSSLLADVNGQPLWKKQHNKTNEQTQCLLINYELPVTDF